MGTEPQHLTETMVIDDVVNSRFKVKRQSFTDPAILEMERRLVFDQCWLYVGHESEIPEAGSFVARRVGGRPIIFSRDVEGQIRIFFDACTHRGNTVCQSRKGKTDRFLCAYHGWIFNTKGELAVVPDPLGYGKSLDRSKLGLGSPPRIDSYRGMVFMSMKADIVDLRTYLNGATDYIDMMLDMTESDPVIAPGQQSYGIQANWKLLLENSADAYHGNYTHMRFFRDYMTHMNVDLSKWKAAWTSDDKALVFDYGHAVIDTPAGPIPGLIERPEVFARLGERLSAKYGEERAARLLGRSQNLLIFPNLVMISAWRTIRTFYPVAVDKMECSAWALVGKDDPEDLREARLSNFTAFLGPAGFGTPDDVEVLENCQRGFAAREMEWTDLSKGMGRAGGAAALDELQMRSLWRRWASLMDPDFVPGVEIGAAQALAAAE